MAMTSYGIDPMLSRLFPSGTQQKKKDSSWSPAPGINAFESMIPGQSAVSGDLSTALLNALQGKFPEEYFSSAIADPMRKTFTQETLPGIKEAFVGPGTYWGTARAGAEVKGRENMEGDIAGKRAELAYQTQLQALQAALAYLGLPLMAAYQPFEEGGEGAAGGSGGGWGSAILRALTQPKPKPAQGPVYSGGNPGVYAGPTSSF